MARKRHELTPAGQARFLALMDQGWTAAAIAADLQASGEAISRSTVDSRMRERRGPVATSRAPGATSFARDLASASEGDVVAAPVLDSGDLPTDDEIEDADESTIDGWLARVELAGKQAAAAQNHPLVGMLAARAATLHAAKFRHTPPEREDPNQAPDMVALGGEVWARFERMVDLVLEERK